jgi:hypothetical protein
MPGQGGKCFYGPTLEIAVDRREKYKERLRGGIPENVTMATLAEYLPFWLENTVRVNVRPATYQHHKRISRNHILPTLGNLKMIDLTADHVQTLHAAKFDAGYALSTRRHIHTTLKAALDQAVRFGHLPFNAAASVRVPTGEGGPSEADADYEDLPDPDMQVWTRRMYANSFGRRPNWADATMLCTSWLSPPGCVRARCSASPGSTWTCATVC